MQEENQNSTENIREFISTGQAAKLCSVTPDTVLKWIKSGRIPASRTPGGHFRINRNNLFKIIESGVLPAINGVVDRPFQFCWEFYSQDCSPENNCFDCIVYRSRAMRCYEVSRLPSEVGHQKMFCKNTCDDCDYYRVVIGQKLNVLVVTNQEQIIEGLRTGRKQFDHNLRIVANGYECSMVVESLRPDYVVLDSKLGMERCSVLVSNLSKDPRIPFVKIIIASDSTELPAECDKTIFAIINIPFSIRDLNRLIGTANKEII
ncbi:MAG: excisionase family DNA-binding protein [candidate division Zixibacteria bacterium]|nr:excisionase family DNA-binding protein [candidate division Zixibacteria bacterium]